MEDDDDFTRKPFNFIVLRRNENLTRQFLNSFSILYRMATSELGMLSSRRIVYLKLER